MSTITASAQPIELPTLPADHAEWISYVAKHTDQSLHDLIAPYKEYDSKLREVYAQQPDHPAIAKSNVVPVFAGHEQELKIRARKHDDETDAERQCYIMPLKKADRKANGSPAVVQSLKDFQTNFQLFSESSLVDMDWSNVVVAGSAVVTSLLPVPEKHNSSKRALREYYHQQLAPASDVDLFLYDLTEEQAVEKIKQIEQRIRDSILTETTTVRTKNAITIASQYPTRHVQIVLRIYRSISEILTGFDVDCSCAAYDGKQVYASPRALAAYMTQINTIDLTRRSPSYENRLSKYSRRGFEIHWPLLDRSRIDPTLFERSFGRTLGLARLLVLEKLPKNTDREAYVDQRRAERGRPTINRWASRKLKGNIKEEHDDDVAEWVETDEVSDYHTFTIPYGPKYHARKIERLLYAKDLLLNAEWNRPKERETTLHRHPAFFGNAIDVIGDCCGYCPEPITPEDKEIAEEESRTYVSGDLSFIKDNPGRQAIGSFNPLTDDDWTEMAYVGNTARLCQAIVDGDLASVEDWLSQEGADPNRRDYTGRTPLHLAVMTSTPQIVQRLIDADARIVARLVDGKTALHLAAMRGEAEMVRRLLMKSEANEEKEAEKESLKRKAHLKAAASEDQDMTDAQGATSNKTLTKGSADEEALDEDDEAMEDSDVDMLDDLSDNADATTENSIVRIDRNKSEDDHENLPDNPSEDDPDIYDVDVLAWDTPVSALHLAIANGHTSVVQILVQEFGADVLLPVKLLHDYNKSARAAILPVVLALQLPAVQARQMTALLLQLGASPAQADMDNVTALQYFAANGVDLLKTMISGNRPSAQRAAGHLSMSGHQYNPSAKSILQTAIDHCDVEGVEVLLELGVKPQIDYAAYTTSFKSKWEMVGDAERNEQQFRQNITQPIMTAVSSEVVPIVTKLLDAGADINTLTTAAWCTIHHGNSYGSSEAHSLLDAVRQKVAYMQEFVDTGKVSNSRGGPFHYNTPVKQYPPVPLKEDSEYLKEYDPSSYMHWRVSRQLEDRKISYQKELESYEERVNKQTEVSKGTKEKKAAVEALLKEFKGLEAHLVESGAKTFAELYPDIKVQERQDYGYGYRGFEPEPPKPWVPLTSFQLPDLTDERRAAYAKLFEACWDGNLSLIKDLTLAVWGDSQTPLQIAVFDHSGFSPFSIALLRKHYDVANAVLEIAQAQYAPEETIGHTKHSLQPADEDDGDSDISEDDVQIYAEIIDDNFTVENIGEVQSKVKSKVAPHTLITAYCPTYQFLEDDDPSTPASANTAGLGTNRRAYGYRYSRDRRAPRKIIKDAANGRTYHGISQPIDEDILEVLKPGNLIQHAICLDDTDLLHLLITMAEEHVGRAADTADGTTSKFYQLPEADFLYAIRLGRVQLLQAIITRTGSGIPLDALVKKSGVEVPKKPKYYQGLSVHGKKREDWANAGREVQETTQEQHPPILHAARIGSLESVEWFSSDASLRCYMEFANGHDEDVRIKNLARAKGGLETAITKWLNLRSHLLLHCVVLGKTTEQSLQLLQTLCKTHPDALEHRSSSGMTPLHLAFHLQRVKMIKVLLEAGAQQTCRDNTGNNIVHTILTSSIATDDKGQSRLRELLSLVDGRLLASLFTERTTAEPGAATPLAVWVKTCLATSPYGHNDTTGREKQLQIILEFSKGADLGIVNGEGDTPLHAVARYGNDIVLRTMLDCRPELLFRENATGRTPYELAEDADLSKEIFADPPSLDPAPEMNHYYYGRRRRALRRGTRTSNILARQPEEFVEELKDARSDVEKVWAVCKEFAKEQRAQGTKRKLVSLVEASEVAKRLARKKGSSDEAEEKKEEGGADDEEIQKGDEVEVWMGMGLQADN